MVRVNLRTRDRDRFLNERERKHMARSCRARVSIPSDDGVARVIFTCSKEEHTDADKLSGAPVNHSEMGRIQLLNGKEYNYYVQWDEVPFLKSRVERRVEDGINIPSRAVEQAIAALDRVIDEEVITSDDPNAG